MTIKHALVVDDSKSARFSLKKLLEQQDIKTDFAESAGDALNYLSSKAPDIIFMDHLMPGMDGFEATRAIKQNPDIQSIPIIMCTSKEGSDYAEQAMAIGAYAILPKPAPAATLVAILNKLNADSAPVSQPDKDESKGSGSSSNTISARVVENIVRKTVTEQLDSFRKSFAEELLGPLRHEFEETINRTREELRVEFQNRVESQIRDQGSAIAQRAAADVVDQRLTEVSRKIDNQLSEASGKIEASLASAGKPTPELIEEVKKIAQFTAAATAGETAKETAAQVSESIAQDISQGELENIKASVLEQASQQSSGGGGTAIVAYIALAASITAVILAWL